eukprot:m.97687 g.97687  ORF g.97687 m.97687 type:complete len:106 (-) comp8675_c0_seq3:256-573(-)
MRESLNYSSTLTTGLDITVICPGPTNLTSPLRGELGATTVWHADTNPRARTAELVAAAVAHRLHEAWIARQPFLLFATIAQYAPDTFRRLASLAARAWVQAYRSE